MWKDGCRLKRKSGREEESKKDRVEERKQGREAGREDFIESCNTSS